MPTPAETATIAVTPGEPRKKIRKRRPFGLPTNLTWKYYLTRPGTSEPFTVELVWAHKDVFYQDPVNDGSWEIVVIGPFLIAFRVVF